MDTLEQKTSSAQGTRRSFSNIGDYVSHVGRATKTGLVAVAAALSMYAQDAKALMMDWKVDFLGSIVNGEETTFQYKVTNNSENNSDYNLLTLTAGTGSDDQVNDASGGYQGDIGTWNKIINQSQTSFSVGSGEPIYASGNPLADFGTFYITSAEQNTALIPFNARAQNGESFATTNIIGPKSISTYQVISKVNSNGGGTVTPSGTNNYTPGTNLVFTFTPDANKEFLKAQTNGADIAELTRGSTGWTWTVNGPLTLEAYFTNQQHNIILEPGSNISINGQTEPTTNKVDHGAEYQFTVTPLYNWFIDQIKTNGTPFPERYGPVPVTKTIPSVEGDITISASAKLVKGTIYSFK